MARLSVGSFFGIAARDVKRVWRGGMRWDEGGDCVAEDVGELVDRFVGGVNEIGDGKAIRSGRGPGVELAQTFSNVRGVDGFKDFGEGLGFRGVGKSHVTELIEGVGDLVVVEMVTSGVGVRWVWKRIISAFAPFVGVFFSDGVRVTVGGVDVGFVGGVGPSVKGARFAGVEGASDPLVERLFRSCVAPRVGMGVV
jgi:hypothetical protein